MKKDLSKLIGMYDQKEAEIWNEKQNKKLKLKNAKEQLNRALEGLLIDINTIIESPDSGVVIVTKRGNVIEATVTMDMPELIEKIYNSNDECARMLDSLDNEKLSQIITKLDGTDTYQFLHFSQLSGIRCKVIMNATEYM